MRMLAGPGSASSLPPLSAARFPEHLASTPVTFGKDGSLAASACPEQLRPVASTSISVPVGNLWKSSLCLHSSFLPFSQSFYLTMQKDESYVCFFFFKLEFFLIYTF